MPKRKQPETSMEALDKKSHDSMNRDYDKIIEAYKHIGSGNYDDVAKFLQLSDANVVSRRMKEMREMGILVRTDVKTPTRRNRMAFVHHLSMNMPKTDKEQKGLESALVKGLDVKTTPQSEKENPIVQLEMEW